jgi:phage shock protein C
MILGVCRGIADYFDLPVFGVRLGAAIALVVTGIFPLIPLYLLAALILRPEPIAPCGVEW